MPRTRRSFTWSEGDLFIARYRSLDGVIRGARPSWVIGDRNGYLATWMPAGTGIAHSVASDGRDLRQYPLDRRYKIGRRSAIHVWEPQGIIQLYPHHGAHSVWVFPEQWYVNLEQVHTWHRWGVDTADHILDIRCFGQGEWDFKDAPDLEWAIRTGVISVAAGKSVHLEAERLINLIEVWGPPFSDGWEQVVPDAVQKVPGLPANWRVLPD